MMSLVTMGEYDDMKYLVRDGSKKLREASDAADDFLLAVNRSRVSATPTCSVVSPRKRLSPNYLANQRPAGLNTPNKSRTLGLPQSAPPKLKGHPRDRPSARKMDEKSRLRESHGYHHEADRGRGVDGDWGGALSFSRGFHSIWNCGGTGEDTGTISPTQVVVGPKDDKNHPMGVAPSDYRPVFEGRGDTNYGHAREGANSTRAN